VERYGPSAGSPASQMSVTRAPKRVATTSLPSVVQARVTRPKASYDDLAYNVPGGVVAEKLVGVVAADGR
jgi:hypothetical protein